jgi:hypothetical protein
MGNIYYPSNENISISQNESKGNDTIENKSILFLNEIYSTSNKSVSSNELVQTSEKTHKEKKYTLNNIKQLIEFETYENSQIEKSHPNNDNNKDESFNHTLDLNNEIPDTETGNELHNFSEIPQSKNVVAAPLDFKFTNKSAIFVNILVSLARKRLK